MKDDSISKNYSNAFVNSLKDSGINLIDFIEKLKKFNKSFFYAKNIDNFLSCPDIDNNEKKQLIKDVALRYNIIGIEWNFIELLFNNNRIFILPEITEQLEKKLYKINNQLKVRIKTSSKPDESLFLRIKKIFKSKTGKEIIVEHVEDLSIIAGIIVEAGNHLYDGSIKTKIENIKKAICEK